MQWALSMAGEQRGSAQVGQERFLHHAGLAKLGDVGVRRLNVEAAQVGGNSRRVRESNRR